MSKTEIKEEGLIPSEKEESPSFKNWEEGFHYWKAEALRLKAENKQLKEEVEGYENTPTEGL
jgi:hypothetical protein